MSRRHCMGRKTCARPPFRSKLCCSWLRAPCVVAETAKHTGDEALRLGEIQRRGRASGGCAARGSPRRRGPGERLGALESTDAATSIATQTVDAGGRGSPISFTLAVPRNALLPRHDMCYARRCVPRPASRCSPLAGSKADQQPEHDGQDRSSGDSGLPVESELGRTARNLPRRRTRGARSGRCYRRTDRGAGRRNRRC